MENKRILRDCDIEVLKEKTYRLLRSTEVEGIEDLINFLEENKFHKQPASTKHHQAYEGGLMEHSLQVYLGLDYMREQLLLELDNKSMILVGLLHDLCKIDCYKKIDDNKFVWNNPEDTRHAAKSIDLITRFIKLTKLEEDAIKYHMGAYEKKEYTWNDLSNVYRADRTGLVYFTHVSDMMSTYDY